MNEQDRLAAPKPEQSPAEYAVEILKRELPGFEAQIHAATDTIRVRTTFKFGATAAIENLYDVRYPVPVGMGPEGTRRAVEAFAAPLIDMTRRAAIEKLGIQKFIDDETERARKRGRDQGYAAGRIGGIAEGRREMLAEVIAAQLDEADAERNAEDAGLDNE